MAFQVGNQRKWVFVATLTFIVLILLRIPFLNQTLIGEEGSFAMIVTGYEGPKSFSNEILQADPLPQKTARARVIDDNCLMLIARIDVQGDFLVRPGRNIVPYCFLGLAVKPVAQLFKPEQASFDNKTQFIRAIFLSLSALGFVSLCILCYLVSRRLSGVSTYLPYLVLLYVTTNHLALGSSIQPQLDGMFGYLLLSNVALLIYLGSNPNLSIFSKFSVNTGAGFLVAFCKNEWPITLLASIGGIFLLKLAFTAFVAYRKDDKFWGQLASELPIVLGLVAGCLAGMGFCYWFSPDDYLGGFGLMKNIHSSRTSHFKIFLKSLYFNRQILMPIIVVLVIGAWCVVKNWRALITNQIGLLVLYVWSCGVFIGFLQSGWGGDGFPRYYLPPLLMGGAFLISQLPALKGHLNSAYKLQGAITICVLATVFNYGKLLYAFHRDESITVPANYVEVKKAIIGAAEINTKDPYGIMVHQASLRYYFPDINFIAIDIGREGALQWKLPSSKYYLVL